MEIQKERKIKFVKTIQKFRKTIRKYKWKIRI